MNILLCCFFAFFNIFILCRSHCLFLQTRFSDIFSFLFMQVSYFYLSYMLGPVVLIASSFTDVRPLASSPPVSSRVFKCLPLYYQLCPFNFLYTFSTLWNQLYYRPWKPLRNYCLGFPFSPHELVKVNIYRKKFIYNHFDRKKVHPQNENISRIVDILLFSLRDETFPSGYCLSPFSLFLIVVCSLFAHLSKHVSNKFCNCSISGHAKS